MAVDAIFPAFTAGHSSIRMCALMPPKPNALTAAFRVLWSSLGYQGSGSVCTRKGPAIRGLPFLGRLNFSDGGKVFSDRASSILIIPAAPAPVSRCPIMDLMEPMAH